MLQSVGVACLERSIIGTCGFQVNHLLIGAYSLVEAACIELAVAYTVQCIGIGRLRGVCLTDKILERSFCLRVHALLEVGITLQVHCLNAVGRLFPAFLLFGLRQVLLGLLVVTRAIGALGKQVTCLSVLCIVGFGLAQDLLQELLCLLDISLPERICS